VSDWVKKLFIEHADLFLKLLNQGWTRAEELVNGMIKVANGFGITSGSLLDLCCGNGRISVNMAKKGFKAVGVDISETFIEDAKKKAQQHNVDGLVTFLRGDVRELKEVVGKVSQPFDIVVNAWTSIGYFSQKDDLNVLKQARKLSREGAILFIAETMHTEYLSIKFAPTAYRELDNIVMLEDRNYNPINARANTSWIFYKRHGKNLQYIDRIDIDHHVYSPSELASLVKDAGWEPLVFYGNLAKLQPMTPLTGLNIVAKAS
jgi:2-polyprenyl-3-methyl-5-hydroxy-6-metoxy-1,4-benzoquinol methylase